MMDIFKHARTMTNDEYHAEREHLSSSRVKAALIHPERMTAPSSIRADVAAEGNRIHTAVIEPDQIHNRYCVAPAPEDYPNALRTADEMRAAIKAAAPNPDDYPDALRTVGDMKAALRAAGVKGYSTQDLVGTIQMVREFIPDAVLWSDIIEAAGFSTKGLSAMPSERLEEMVRNSLPNALLWSDVLSRHGNASAGKEFCSQEEWDQMHRVAEAVMAHEVIKAEGLFTDGVGEASFFADVSYNYPAIWGRQWPMKCRPDWLQWHRVTDLKTWRGGKPAHKFDAHANDLHYDLSAAMYLDVLRVYGYTGRRFTWVVVDKATVHSGGRVLVHVRTMSDAFLEQGRDKLRTALEAIADWESSPKAYDRQFQVEEIAEPPRWGWR